MSSYVYKKTPGETGWFIHDRFGMFIHFGIYAVPSKGEWYLGSKRVSYEEYNKYFQTFDPDLMDARQWAKMAKAAGMKYAVLTSKHHDGFCLFDSKYTDYKSTNTPCSRDLVKEFVEAFRAEGLKVGLYYSLIDWHHPDFPIDHYHPRRYDADAEQQDKGRDMKKYARYIRDQVTELLTNYGKIDIMWFDFSYFAKEGNPSWMQFGGAKGKEQWESEKLLKLIRSLQPHIIINNRSQIPQDIDTPEQSDPLGELIDPVTGECSVWETCQTFSGAWGYNRDENSWKSDNCIIDSLVRSVAYGGNLIMNVGPTGRGEFDERVQRSLQVYADWMRYNSRAIYGCTRPEPGISCDDGILITQSMDEKRLYLHIVSPMHKRISLRGVELDQVVITRYLKDGTEIMIKVGSEGDGTGIIYGKRLELRLPDCFFHTLVPVIEIVLK